MDIGGVEVVSVEGVLMSVTAVGVITLSEVFVVVVVDFFFAMVNLSSHSR